MAVAATAGTGFSLESFLEGLGVVVVVLIIAGVLFVLNRRGRTPGLGARSEGTDLASAGVPRPGVAAQPGLPAQPGGVAPDPRRDIEPPGGAAGRAVAGQGSPPPFAHSAAPPDERVARPVARSSAALGSRSQFGCYRLEEQIGRGGMGEVFRAWDTQIGRPVALKLLAAEFAGDEEFAHRFMGEYQASALDHPNIIPVFAAGQEDGVRFFAMRYVPGGDVRSLVDRLGRLAEPDALAITAQVASALDHIHGHGFLHRDVKPANILVDKVGPGQRHAYLSDFGLSKYASSTRKLTHTGSVLGTLDYCSPEQLSAQPVDGQTDQFALACSAFEMLAGTPPFRHAEAPAGVPAQLFAPPASLKSYRPDLPGAVDAVFARALAKVAGQRFASCGEFASALRAAVGQAPGAAAPDPIDIETVRRSYPPTQAW